MFDFDFWWKIFFYFFCLNKNDHSVMSFDVNVIRDKNRNEKKMNLTTYDWLSWICIRVPYIVTWGELIFRLLLPSIQKIKITIGKKNIYYNITIEYIFCPMNEI